MGKTLREHSRNMCTADDPTIETVTAGSLQRIADAVEIMAKDRVQMERHLKWYKDAYASRGKTIEALESQIKGLKIYKARFKNQLDKLKGGDNNG